MNVCKLVGGPSVFTTRLITPETGEAIHGITRLTLHVDPRNANRMVTAEIQLVVDVDMEIDLSQLKVTDVLNLAQLRHEKVVAK